MTWIDAGNDVAVGGGDDSLIMEGRMTGAILTDEDGDGDFDLKLTGLNDGNQYTVTVLDQAPMILSRM